MGGLGTQVGLAVSAELGQGGSVLLLCSLGAGPGVGLRRVHTAALIVCPITLGLQPHAELSEVLLTALSVCSQVLGKMPAGRGAVPLVVLPAALEQRNDFDPAGTRPLDIADEATVLALIDDAAVVGVVQPVLRVLDQADLVAEPEDVVERAVLIFAHVVAGLDVHQQVRQVHHFEDLLFPSVCSQCASFHELLGHEAAVRRVQLKVLQTDFNLERWVDDCVFDFYPGVYD